MLKVLAVMAIALTLAVPAMALQNKDSGNKHTAKPQQVTPPASTVTNNEATTYYQQSPEDKPKGWHKLIAWPDGITAWAILLTLGAITWQAVVGKQAARAAEKGADAALIQANHLVTSERAWMVAEPYDPKIPPEVEGLTTGIRHVGFAVRFKNVGETPAFLLEIRYSGKVYSSKESLPAVPPEYEEREIFKWGGEGLPILPRSDIFKTHVNTWAKEPVLIMRGFDVLWIYGYIKYKDAFENTRETWFCFRWVQHIEGWQESGFIAGGPESYNRAT